MFTLDYQLLQQQFVDLPMCDLDIYVFLIVFSPSTSLSFSSSCVSEAEKESPGVSVCVFRPKRKTIVSKTGTGRRLDSHD